MPRIVAREWLGGCSDRVVVHRVGSEVREHDLVLGTHGRAIYILDDITPLRALAAGGPDLVGKGLHLRRV